LGVEAKKDVDARHKAGHDDGIKFKIFRSPCRAAAPSFVYWPEHAFSGECAMSMNVLGEPVSMRDHVLNRLVGGLIILCLVVDGASKLVPWPSVIEAMDRIGYGSNDALARALGAVTTACIALTTIPPTSIVGAILWTSYLGNALVTHLPIV
jgi:hypothetical protein